MTTALIHDRFTTPDTYSWTVAATLRHLDPAKDRWRVQLGNTHRFADAFDAELVIFDMVYRDLRGAFPGHGIGKVEVVRFDRASDGALA